MVQVTDTIAAQKRARHGKGGSHKTRASGFIPAIAYGAGREPLPLELEPKAFVLARLQHGRAHLYNVAVEGQETFKALVKAVQQDPVSQEPVHVDFLAVDMTKALRVDVPVVLLGKALGENDGGVLAQLLHYIEVQCLPAAIPAKIELDVSGLALNHSLHVSDIKFPAGVTTTVRPEEAVAAVAAPKEEAAAPTPDEAAAALAATAAEGAAPPVEGGAEAAKVEGADKPDKAAKAAAKGDKPDKAAKPAKPAGKKA